jgi:hypothetical protein
MGLTRLTTLRDVAYFTASQVLPTVWIVYRLSDLTLSASLQQFAAGYFAFISIYEIGYLANDAWDAARDPNGRRRLPFAVDAPFVLLFVGIRAAIWTAIGVGSGWIFDTTWLAGFACLAVVFGLHNFIPSGAIRSATFLQLAVLRIVLPALGAIGSANLVLAVLVSTFLYAYLRFLSYLDGKKLLIIPERRNPLFPLSQIAIFVPMAAFISVATSQSLFLELSIYFLAVYGANVLRPHIFDPNGR